MSDSVVSRLPNRICPLAGLLALQRPNLSRGAVVLTLYRIQLTAHRGSARIGVGQLIRQRRQLL